MAAQIERTRPMEKRLWALVVAAKIRRQGWALQCLGRPAGAFARLARSVKAGDPDNLEAQAARRYWPLLFDSSFRRDPDAAGANALLNYGYAVLRAAVARSLCAVGLHPGLGIFHRHPQNPMPLAYDMMEPFRPVVDEEVVRLLADGTVAVTVPAKRRLAALLLRDEQTAAGTSPLATALLRCAASLADSYLTGEAALEFPDLRLKDTADDTDPEWLPDHVVVTHVRSAGDDEAAAEGGDRL